MSSPVISIRDLVKRYGRVEALRGVTVDVPSGPVGLLGPNGAGKTTLIKLLLGMLIPTEGEARIAGCDPRRSADRLRVRQAVGYMPEGDCLLPDMSGVELVATLARLTGLKREDAMTRAHEVLDYVELEEARYRKVDQYSTGMKQRLKLAQSLVHDPDVLLLDEPTNGLDPKGRRHMLTLIDDLGRHQEKNILLCSHLLPDVERTCDHAIVLDRGRVVEAGVVEELTRADGLALRVSIEGDTEAFRAALGAAGIEVGTESTGRLSVHLDAGSEDADQLFALAVSCGVAITALEPVRSSLEEVFLRAVGVSGNGAASPEAEL